MEDLADMFDNGVQAQFLDDEPKKLEVEVVAPPKIVVVTDFDTCMKNMFNDSTSKKFSTYMTIAEFARDVL